MIPNLLKARRFYAGKSQDQIAVETGISQSKISRIEIGAIKPKQMDKKQIAKALNCKPGEIFPED